MPAAQARRAEARSSAVMAISGGQGCGCCVAIGGHAEADGFGPAGEGEFDLGEFVVGGGEADPERFGLAGPAFALGLGDAGGQVAADVLQPMFLGGVGPEEGAPGACVFMDATGSPGPSAVAEGKTAAFEVAEEVVPLGVGGSPVFLGRTEFAPAGDECPVAVDRFFGVDGFVAMVVLMFLCPMRSWQMCAGRPFMIASVAKILLRKSCGVNRRAWPDASVSPVLSRALLIQRRITAALIGRLSAPMLRWNSTGIGGVNSHSWTS